MTADAKASKADTNARYIGDVFGSLVFPGRTQADVAVAAFHARSVSTRSATIECELVALRGEPVALRFDGIGIRHGEVERVYKGGFIVRFPETAGESAMLSGKIGWLKAKSRGKAEDRRGYARVLPRDGAARLILGREQNEMCTIKDMSQSGAAILADAQPPIGHLVAIGSVPGHVVRHFEGGFAIRFVEIQRLDLLEGMMTLRTGAEKTLAARRLNASEKRLKDE